MGNTSEDTEKSFNRPGNHPYDVPLVPWDGPSKIVFEEPVVLIMLGAGQGNLVSQALIETTEDVEKVTLYVLNAEVSQREGGNDSDSDDDNEDPVLRFNVVNVMPTMSLAMFFVSEDRAQDSARLKIKIQVPKAYDGTLVLGGSFLDIYSRTLEEAKFWELFLSTDEGDIDLQGRTRAMFFKATVKRQGNIRTGILESTKPGEAIFEATVKTASGDVFLDAKLTKLLDGSSGYVINAMTKNGQVHLDVREDKETPVETDTVPGILKIETESNGGGIKAKVELIEGQKLMLDANSVDDDVIIRLSDYYSGTFSVASSQGKVSFLPKSNSESVIHYRRLDQEEVCGVKYPVGAEGPQDIVGDYVRVTATQGLAKIKFT
ncbi:hypothetical protein BGX28_006037 [Mortierella sp. GBA30]|nr:hypothetical protein BGX28_006037 [Mortierella sp. GBA30]